VYFLTVFIGRLLAHRLFLRFSLEHLSHHSWTDAFGESLVGALLFGLFFTFFIRKSRNRSD
jgi:hypothetical protein